MRMPTARSAATDEVNVGHALPHRRRRREPHGIQQKNTVSRMGDGVFLHALRFHDPLPDVCVGAVTSVRVTPLEKVRLLRMVEKSLDMLR